MTRWWNRSPPILEEGDLLIDGGNSDYHDTERRVKQLESKSFGFIGMGVSGGAKGALEGPSMMPGGTKASYDAIESLVNKMAAQVEDGPCVTYIGPGGSGHLVKTVHNGIEYGIEQILAEGYDLMKRVKGMNGDQMADVLARWNATEELSSYSGGDHGGLPPHQGSRGWRGSGGERSWTRPVRRAPDSGRWSQHCRWVLRFPPSMPPSMVA